jgi:hypothetical protein
VVKQKEVALEVQYQVKYKKKKYYACTLASIKMVIPDLKRSATISGYFICCEHMYTFHKLF